MSFVPLHIHSDYSLLDGASQLPQLIDKAVELGMEAIALTDHGVMYGAIQLIKQCRNKKIKPIIGNEMYVINGDLEDKKTKRRKYHQIVLAKSTQGYKNLVKLTTISHLEGVQGKGIFSRPCINKETLEKYHEDLIVTSGCMAGEVPQAILQGKPDEARKTAKWYKKLFGEDYYLEIQDHGYQEDRIINVEIVKIAKELGIKVVATNDSHFISCMDVEAHDALLCINTQKLITEEKRMRYSGTEYLKSVDEMRQLFRDHLDDDVIEEAIANTQEVAAKIKSYDILGEMRIPNYKIPNDHTPATYLEKVTWEGLAKRFGFKGRSDVFQLKPKYAERLKYELGMIDKMGFSTYFLVVWDYMKYARDNGIPVGPGRGSAAGSLVAFALKITNIDPVHHGLLFERFLNPERKSMPDIDSDFCIERRDDMIKYVTETYGEDKVAQIITFNRMTSKAVLKDVARVLGIPYGDADKMAKLIPVARGKPAKLKVMISDETPAPEFKEAYENKAISVEDSNGDTEEIPVRQWIDMAIGIEGTNRTFGVHAAGVLISKDPLDEIVPLQKNNDGAVIAQYYMEDLEALGLLKMDFLGLRNLTIIEKTVKAIKENHKIAIDAEDLPADERKAMEIAAKRKKLPEDVKKTYKLIESGDLEGVFQLESSGMVDVVKKLKPSSIEDISSILALYRPGPLDAGLIPKFIDRKHGREEIKYDHPLLEPILNETYGVLCLPKGTLIDKPDGSMVAIENVKSGQVVLTSDGEGVWPAKVAKQWRSGIKEILKITLSSGTVIYSGKNHRFLTPEGDKFAWELKPAEGGLKNAHIYSSAVYEKWPVSAGNKQLCENEAYLLGLLIGNGNLVSSTPNIACPTEKGAAWVASLIYETWGGEAKYYFNTRCWYAYSKFKTQPKPTPMTEFMDGIYGDRSWKVKSVTKHLPEDILDYSEKDRIDLLRGLWDSDGCYSQKLLYYRSSSRGLLAQVGKLLASLKISYYLGKNYVCVSDRTRFLSILGKSQMPEKQVDEVAENYLPISSVAMATGLKYSIGKTDSLTRKTVKRSLAKATLFKPKNSQYKTKLENWDNCYKKIYQKTYLQDARLVYVVSVEAAGEADCFDLEMADQTSPYFVAQGVVVHNCYQEQIMKMAQDLAGYSLGQADLLRRAISKKKVAEMEKQREIFIDGATKKGVSARIAESLFDQMVKFAEYCFNKSHSTAYAYVSYQTAYLKANYPVEYMSALLTANSGDQDKVQKYIANCQRFDIEIEPPNINKSRVDFTPLPKIVTGEEKDKILFGFSAVKNLGHKAIDEILRARDEEGEFKSMPELCDRIDLQTINTRKLESLVNCGAFDSIEPNRQKLVEELPGIISWAQKRNQDRDSGQLNLFDLGMSAEDKNSADAYESAPRLPNVADYSIQDKLEKEKEVLGFYVSDHPLEHVLQQNPVADAVTIAEIQEKKSRAQVKTLAMLAEVKLHTTKKGDRMAFLKIEDMSGQLEAVVFASVFEDVRSFLTGDAEEEAENKNPVFVITGKTERKDEETQLIVEKMEIIEQKMAEAVDEKSGEGIEEKSGEELEEKSEEGIEDKLPALENEPPEVAVEVEEHPAKLARQNYGARDLILVEALEGMPEKTPVKAIGKLTKVKQITTKHDDEMAFLDLEDETGKVDVTVFPRTYQQVKSWLEEGALVLACGKTQNRDGKIQLVADKLMKVEVDVSLPVPPVAPQKQDEEFVSEKSILTEAKSMVVLQLTLEEVEDVKRLENLRGILQEYSGNLEKAQVPVGAMVVGKYHRQLLRFPRSCWVENPEVVVNRLRGQSWNVQVLALGDRDFPQG